MASNLSRRSMMKAAGVAALAPQGYLALGASATRPPNIVLIIADDMGWDDCGAYGHPTVRTPHIDQLAAEGMRFTHAFLTASSCSPSRAGIITGRYPHNTDAEQLHWPLPAEQVTFVELLGEAGYWTAAAGKWHLGDSVRDRFDVVHEADPSGFQLPTGRAGETPAMIAPEKSGCERWLSTLQSRPKDRPFFLWLAALDPHRDYETGVIPEPHRPPDVRVPPYLPDVPAVRRELALYYDEITRLDDYVGQVLEELARGGVADNTFVLFLSDNGRPFPRDKTTLYDGGIKTPWIVRWPARVPAGSVCEQLVSAVDIAPTILGLAGLEAPASCEGRDFRPLLAHPAQAIREYALAEAHWHDYENLGRAVRSRRYKYILNDYADLPATPPADVCRSPTFQAMRRLRAEGRLNRHQVACFATPRPKEELYDIARDPHELVNLANEALYAGVRAEFRRVLAQWSEKTGYRVPEVRTPDEFDRDSGAPLPNRIRPRPSKKAFLEARVKGSVR